MLKKLVAAWAMMVVVIVPAYASMTVKEFRKFSAEQQGVYIGAAVSMLAYTFASEGNTAKARCIQNWYYGEPGKETPGPRAVTVELAVAEESGAERYTVEGIILGLTDKVCNQSVSPPPTRR